ncbi:MAG TPA: branched-chain amino acid ABC transporter permease [Candidatus Eisenbacteria bacterium]|nr:branched-chain amino acid ABC transporter permease [Candidatus Eisenbacteria bacterium]
MARRLERIDRPIKVLTDDIYALSSTANMLYVAAPRILPALIVMAVPALSPSVYFERVWIITAIYALLALSWDFVALSTGLVSLGQALFFGVGAYLAAILNLQLGIPSLWTLPLAGLGGAAICTVLLAPCLPLRGIYFAMTTLVYPLLLARTIEATAIVGGTDGLVGVEPFPSLWLEKYLVLVVLLASTYALRRLMTSDFGIVLRSISDNDQAAKAAGINITWYKLIALWIGSALGSFAGAYFTHLYMFVGLSAFSLDLSILPIACAVVGGIGTLAGPVVGAFILVPLTEMLRDAGTLRIVAYSLLLVALVLLRPEGVLSYLKRKYEQVERWVEV